MVPEVFRKILYPREERRAEELPETASPVPAVGRISQDAADWVCLPFLEDAWDELNRPGIMILELL